MRFRFFWKLFASSVCIMLLTSLLVGIGLSMKIRSNSRNDIRLDLEATCRILSEMAFPSHEGAPDSRIQARIEQLGPAVKKRLTVFSREEAVMADSIRAPHLLADTRARPEILAARAGGVGFSERESGVDLGEESFFFATAVRSDTSGELLGFVRASVPIDRLGERVAEFMPTLILGGLVAVLLSLVLGYFLSRRVAVPIATMTQVADEVAGGDFDRLVDFRGSDEVGQLVGAFNSMAKQLRDRVETITVDRNKLLTILSGMVEGLVAVDADEKVLHMNRAAQRILDVQEGDGSNQHIWEVTRVWEVSSVLRRTIKTGEKVESETHLVGQPRDRLVELFASPLVNGEGRLVGAVLVLHDVSKIRQLESVRRDFVSNVSHELKTPVTAIRGFAETIEDDPEMEEATRNRFVGRIKEQSLRLSALVADLLTLARLESQEGGLCKQRLDMRSVVDSSTRATIAATDGSQVKIEIDLPDRPVFVFGDEEALEQVLNNLLSNALKYTLKEGRVTVRVREEGGNAWIQVEDTGVGIEPVHLGRIFERFYRVDKARSRELGGTGLGLSIVKHFCLAHGGDVSVASTPGKGSVFTVRLPAGSSESSAR